MRAMDTAGLLEKEPAKVLIEGNDPILAEVSGTIAVKFDQALKVLESPSLLEDIQDEYGALLAAGEEPGFKIHSVATHAYYYVNKDGERTDIEELVRKKSTDGGFDLIYYSYGECFLGKYEAVIHVHLCADQDRGIVAYAASVYAYPKNAFSRFFARRLGLVEDYFEDKTDEMSGIIAAISQNLCKAEAGERGKDQQKEIVESVP